MKSPPAGSGRYLFVTFGMQLRPLVGRMEGVASLLARQFDGDPRFVAQGEAMPRTARPLFYGVTFMFGAAALTGCAPADADTTRTGAGQVPVVATQSAGTAGGTAVAAAAAKSVISDVSQLKRLGITLNAGVLIDVADDGLDRYLAVGKGGAVDFTGTRSSADDNKMMSLKPARVASKSLRNRVVIAPPFYNEDLGAGSCVADTAPGKLRLATCKAGSADQTWNVVPAGDSGQFELHGAHTAIRVNNGKITTGARGYVGLQTIDFAR